MNHLKAMYMVNVLSIMNIRFSYEKKKQTHKSYAVYTRKVIEEFES
jgi:hypothetical protein